MKVENAKRYISTPEFEYNGQLVFAFLYFKGNSDTVHSWDIVMRGVNLSKQTEARIAYGFTDEDMDYLNTRIASYILQQGYGR
jgi:hypothetical protein